MRKGITTFELLIVVIIAAILINISLGIISTVTRASYYQGTQSKLEAIKIALTNYQNKFGRLPCPADRTMAPSGATYMEEVASCQTSSCSAGIVCPADVAIGAVPAKTLGISSSVGIDLWTNKIVYAVDQRSTLRASSDCQVRGKLIILDSNGNALSSNGNAEFILISMGQDGAGAYSIDGTLRETCDTLKSEGENCDDNNAAFREGRFSDSDNADYFDDMLVWSPNYSEEHCPAGISGCTIWFDAADTCSVNDTSGVVNSWQDKSLNNLSAISGTSSPTYMTTTSNLTKGNAYLQFSSASIDLLNASGINSTIFPANDFSQTIVFLPTTTSNSAIINTAPNALYNTSTPDCIFGLLGGGEPIFSIAGTTLSAVSPASITVPTIATAKVDSTAGSSFFINGVQVASNSTLSASLVNPTYLNMGGIASMGAFNGKILEIVVYNRILTTSEQEQLETYLAAKWGAAY